jgi:hypothetical protein
MKVIKCISFVKTFDIMMFETIKCTILQKLRPVQRVTSAQIGCGVCASSASRHVHFTSAGEPGVDSLLNQIFNIIGRRKEILPSAESLVLSAIKNSYNFL